MGGWQRACLSVKGVQMSDLSYDEVQIACRGVCPDCGILYSMVSEDDNTIKCSECGGRFVITGTTGKRLGRSRE